MEAPQPLSALSDILVVESNPAEARLIAEAFRDAGYTRKIEQFHNGEDAISYLQQPSVPDLILLDLSLPRKSGLELLEEIRSTEILKCIPVIILSGSTSPVDLRRAYELHANCYIRKPDDLDDFLKMINACYQFWGRIVRLPPRSRLS